MRRDKIRHEFKEMHVSIYAKILSKIFLRMLRYFLLLVGKTETFGTQKILPMALFCLSRIASFASFIAQSLLLICLEMTGTDLKR